MKEIILSRELITPARAKALLENNTMNRKLQIGWAMKIADKMLKGDWIEQDGATIKINENGTIIDGQHRLKAIIIANKSYKMNISYNVDTKAYLVTDTHKSRGLLNYFEMLGEKNCRLLASIVPTIDDAIRKNKFPDITILISKSSNAKRIYDQETVDKFYPQNKNYFINVASITLRITKYQGKLKIIPDSIIGIFLGYVSQYYGLTIVEKYLTDILKGENISSTSIEFQIRKKLLEIKTDPFISVTNEIIYNMLIHGWNLKLEGKSWSRNKYNGEKVKLLGTEGKIIDYKIVEL